MARRKPQLFYKGDLVEVSGVAITKDGRYPLIRGVGGDGPDGSFAPGTQVIRWVDDIRNKSNGRLIGQGRPLVVIPHQFTGMVVGWSTRRSGVYYRPRPGSGWVTGDYYDEGSPGSLEDVQVHKVYMVIRTDTEQYSPPVAVLPEFMQLSQVQKTVILEIRKKAWENEARENSAREEAR